MPLPLPGTGQSTLTGPGPAPGARATLDVTVGGHVVREALQLLASAVPARLPQSTVGLLQQVQAQVQQGVGAPAARDSRLRCTLEEALLLLQRAVLEEGAEGAGGARFLADAVPCTLAEFVGEFSGGVLAAEDGEEDEDARRRWGLGKRYPEGLLHAGGVQGAEGTLVSLSHSHTHRDSQRAEAEVVEEEAASLAAYDATPAALRGVILTLNAALAQLQGSGGGGGGAPAAGGAAEATAQARKAVLVLTRVRVCVCVCVCVMGERGAHQCRSALLQAPPAHSHSLASLLTFYHPLPCALPVPVLPLSQRWRAPHARLPAL